MPRKAHNATHRLNEASTERKMHQVLIKHRYTDAVLYTHETTDERQASGFALRDAMEAACKRGTNLRGVNLSGAKVNGLELVGARPFMAIGPIGSELRTISVWLTAEGLRIQAGCFFGSRDEFVAKLAQTHGDNEHAQEYTAALVLIDMHAKLWAVAPIAA